MHNGAFLFNFALKRNRLPDRLISGPKAPSFRRFSLLIGPGFVFERRLPGPSPRGPDAENALPNPRAASGFPRAVEELPLFYFFVILMNIYHYIILA
jgi:hypothetical protein